MSRTRDTPDTPEAPEAPEAPGALSSRWSPEPRPIAETASQLVDLLRARGETMACVESLTAGLVSAGIADVPGASDVLVGGLVTYQARAKTAVAQVCSALVAEVGTVHPQVAREMARGGRAALASTWAVATTGVAGPGPAEGHPAGTVWLAVAGPDVLIARLVELTGDRAQVRRASAAAAVQLLLDIVRGHRPAPEVGA